MNKIEMCALVCLLEGAVSAATGASNEFRLDTRTGVRTAAATEKIQYSTAWATNLTASGDTEDATHEIKAVVKVNPCLKTPPKYLVVDMSGGRSAARWPISYLDEVPSGGWTDEYKTEKLVLRYIPAGSFIMGGRATDYPGAVNTNLHMVTLTKPFYIGVFECTQKQWQLVMGSNPSSYKGDCRPVECVSYSMIRGTGAQAGAGWPTYGHAVDGTSFMGKLQAKTGLVFDLPTEAQWEYACRLKADGTCWTTALNSGKNLTSTLSCPNMAEVGRYYYNQSDGKGGFSSAHTKVGSYRPSELGLYDMHGNVWEWCLDWYVSSLGSGAVEEPKGPATGSRRLLRGGGWDGGARDCRSASRGYDGPLSNDYYGGFRVASLLVVQ